MNTLRQNRNNIYALKRKYGLLATIYKPDEPVCNIETGAIIQNEEKRIIIRAIHVPVKAMRTFVYDLSYIAANKNFTYGGLFDKDTEIVIIDRRDIKNFVIDLNCYIVFNNKKYNIVDLQDVEELSSYMLTVKATTGDLPEPEPEPSVSPS